MHATGKILTWGLAALAAVGASAIAVRSIDRAAVATLHATVLPAPLPLPDFSLVDQDGNAFTRESLLGRPTLLFFGFTHCPDICPATLQQLALARRKLATSGPADGPLPEILLISVDPQRDSAQVLRDFVSYFGPGIAAASGVEAELQKLTSVLGIYYAVNAAGESGYTVDHSAAVLLINADAEFAAIFAAPLDVDQLVTDLRILGERT